MALRMVLVFDIYKGQSTIVNASRRETWAKASTWGREIVQKAHSIRMGFFAIDYMRIVPFISYRM